eukprot:COSAG01_NODE_3299_length_6296_cov_243.565112_1_plen_23_part_10
MIVGLIGEPDGCYRSLASLCMPP